MKRKGLHGLLKSFLSDLEWAQTEQKFLSLSGTNLTDDKSISDSETHNLAYSEEEQSQLSPPNEQEKKVEEQSQLSPPNEPKTCTAGEDSSNVECVPDDDNRHSIENSSCEDSSNEGGKRATTSKEKAPVHKQEKKVEEHSQLSPPNEPKTCTAGEDS